MQKKQNRLQELDAIRGLAALFVVIYHYTFRYYEIYPSDNRLPFVFEIGHYGVQAFFIVSGFVIFMTLEKTKRSLDFVVHRFIRLFPTYWISVLITFIVVAIFSLPGRETTFLEFLANLTMVHTQFGIPSVDGVYWTLLFELKFYFWMILLYHFKLLDKIETISFILLACMLFSTALGLTDTILYKVCNQVFILQYISFFISGVMFYKIYSSTQNYLTYIVLALAFTISYLTNAFDFAYVIIAIYGMFILLAMHKLNFITVKPLVFLGTISYSLYLVHQNIGYIILNFAQSSHFSMFYATFFSGTVSIVIATLITFMFEKNVMSYLRSLYKVYSKKGTNV